jgi:hypothetical protein
VFFSSKCLLFHNATLICSCIIHVLKTGLLKFKRKFRRQRVKLLLAFSVTFSTRSNITSILSFVSTKHGNTVKEELVITYTEWTYERTWNALAQLTASQTEVIARQTNDRIQHQLERHSTSRWCDQWPDPGLPTPRPRTFACNVSDSRSWKFLLGRFSLLSAEEQKWLRL